MLTLVPRQPPTRRLASLRASPSALSVSPRLSHSENGGTILAVAGENFTVIAGDTRQSEGYSIQTRYAPKVFRLSVSSTGVSCSSTACYTTGPCLAYTPMSTAPFLQERRGA